MTEIPEHLLKRSKAAKAKAAGEPAAEDGGATPAATTPATTAPAAAPAAAPAKAAKAAPAAPPPPKPDIPVVAAAKARKKIPFWAMATLSILPLWVFMYARSLTPVEKTVAGPLGEGAGLYTSAACSGCHGAAGEGGTGYAFAEGEILQTFPHIEDMLRWVYSGTNGYQVAGVEIYGNPEREGGPHLTGARGIMPAQGSTQGGALTDAEILAVSCHVRYTIGGADPTAEYLDEYTKWCSPESEVFAGLEGGTYTFENLADSVEGTFPVGITPAPGNPPDAQP